MQKLMQMYAAMMSWLFPTTNAVQDINSILAMFDSMIDRLNDAINKGRREVDASVQRSHAIYQSWRQAEADEVTYRLATQTAMGRAKTAQDRIAALVGE